MSAENYAAIPHFSSNDALESDYGSYESIEESTWKDSLKTYMTRIAGAVAVTSALLGGASVNAEQSNPDETRFSLSANDSPSCYGDYCSGQYADQTGCDKNARPLTELIVTDKGVHVGANISAQPGITIDNGGKEKEIAKLEVRWSDECGTSWARLNTREETDINVVGIEQDGGYTQTRDIGRFSEGSPSALSFTPMIYGRDHSYQAFIMRQGSAIGNPFTDERTSTYWSDEDLR